MHYTDNEIIQSLKNRDDRIIAFIIWKNLPLIERMVQELGCGMYEAEDLFQEALIILITKIDSGAFKLKTKFSVYLLAVCKNLCKYENGKEMQKESFFRMKLDNEDFSENYDKELKEKIFIENYHKLSDFCQLFLKLYWLNYKIKEIAQALGKPTRYISRRKYKCKKRLIEMIKKDRGKN